MHKILPMNYNDLFVFVSNDEYKKLLARDFEELAACVNAGLNKSVLVLSGSILEAVLIEYFTSTSNNSIEGKRILDLTLNKLIEKAESEGLISKKAKELSSIVRDYRNYIHPAKEIRNTDSIDDESSVIAFSLLKMILKEISANYYKKYEHKAETVYNKIASDDFALPIFEDLVEKMNKSEINKLLSLLVNGYINRKKYDEDDFESPFQMSVHSIYSYYETIRPLVDNSIIKDHLHDFINQMTQGSNKVAFIYFDLFGSELNLLTQEQIQLVLKYIYSVLNGTYLRVINYRYTRTFEHLRLYKDNPGSEEKFMSLLISIVHALKSDKKNERVYLSIFKTLSEEIKNDDLDDYLKKRIDTIDYEYFKQKIDDYDLLY